MKEIQLTQGQVTLVDDEDYEWLSQYNWYAHWNRRSFNAAYHKSDEKVVLMHRKIMKPPANMEVDHINGNALDNRRSNLRLATSSQNKANVGPRKGKRYKGTYWYEAIGKYVATITKNSRSKNLGCFDYEEDAARAYDKAARELHGEFARLNFPDNRGESA